MARTIEPALSAPVIPRSTWVACAIASLLVAGAWVFPSLWYRQDVAGKEQFWLHERDEIKGWSFRRMKVTENEEKVLVADTLFSGEFTREQDHSRVRVFSAKRYSEKPDESGLFMHTPDRCWTDAGWKLEAVTPDYVELPVHGHKMLFERRVFVTQAQRELVYFGGLVGGQPVPYRLDHNLSIGMRQALRHTTGKSESTTRASDFQFWKRIWQGFVDRNPLLGPKQFMRISVPAGTTDLAQGDRMIREFLELWLEPTDYQSEVRSWQTKPR